MTTTASVGQESCNPFPRWLLPWDIASAAGLVAAASVWHAHHTADLFGVNAPPAALWFGAVGGVSASLQGVFLHCKCWNGNYNRWHLMSGVVGAAFGLVSYLFLLVIVKSASSTDTQAVPPVYALGAFAIGYGQREFNSMMQQVFQVLFREPQQPGKTPSAPAHDEESDS